MSLGYSGNYITISGTIMSGSIINGVYYPVTKTQDEIKIYQYTYITPGSVINYNGELRTVISPLIIDIDYKYSTIKYFDNEDKSNNNIKYNYIPSRSYVTFFIPILEESHAFDKYSKFNVKIENLRCSYGMLSFD